MRRLLIMIMLHFTLLSNYSYVYAQNQDFEVYLELERQILIEAETLLKDSPTPYKKGGKTLKAKKCEDCSECLLQKKPSKAKQLCGKICQSCGVDCSNFTKFVYNQVGLDYPYLSSAEMIHISKRNLYIKYGLVDLGKNLDEARPGDLLVYKGHVAILERMLERKRGDIIHAASTRTYRKTGNGIHRRKNANLANLRGPLVKILRHYKLAYQEYPHLNDPYHEEWLAYQEQQMRSKEPEICSIETLKLQVEL